MATRMACLTLAEALRLADDHLHTIGRQLCSRCASDLLIRLETMGPSFLRPSMSLTSLL